MARLTIEELAHQSGATTRNIRNYQTRRLLPPPTVIGRVGYYDDGHLARLRLIANLQGRGYSLAAIGDLLRAWQEGRSVGDILGFEQALTEPWDDQTPERVPVEVLLGRFPEAAGDDHLIDRAIGLGLVAIDGDDVVVLRPDHVAVGADLVAAGVPLAAALDELEVLTTETARIAERFVDLFDRHIWAPFESAGMPAENLADVTAALHRLRPLAARAVRAALGPAMDRRVAQATADRAARLPGHDQRASG